jgi:Secretion system C-terminal sorting domain
MRNCICQRFIHPKLMMVILLSLAGYCAKGQEAVPAAGGNASSAEGSVSYSVGQLGFTTFKSAEGRVSEGVQQTYEIAIVLELDEAKIFTLKCSAYPNPVVDYLTLSVDENHLFKLSCQLFTIDGKLIETKEIRTLETAIYMGTLRPAIYFLRVYETLPSSTFNHSPQRILKTFKIIKN